jgi:hypothetical protein
MGIDYNTWVSKHKGMKRNEQSAQKFYEATGKDMPETVAKKVDSVDRKQEYGQWLGAQKKPGLQKSNWWSGIKYRQQKGHDPTKMQEKAKAAYVKKKQGRGAGQAGSTGRPS